ncbi:MAG: cellulase family glycosylhydrolase [Prolixibacteraceae bacterium]|nr:cellulase family glycosylhydrolase [Prolixibacteraceae bacterium]
MIVVLAVLMGFCSGGFSQEQSGMKVIGRHLYDKCGEKVIIRGVSNPNIWFEHDGLIRYREIEKTGANVVRIVWQTWGSPSALDEAIQNCINLHMIPMIELHDATGEWDKLQDCVDYWIRPDVVDVIVKHEEYLLVNIANEVGDYNVTKNTFRNGYINAVQSMRDAGIHVPLIIDGSDWGKNVNIMQSEGPAIIEADPDHNIIFSVHMWWPKMYGFSENDIVTEIAQSVEMELPLIVGEFSQMHGSCDESEITSNNSIAYKTILRECQENEIGYIAWSWFGNCNPLWDMSSDGTFENLYSWGLEVAVTDENSIKNTSVRPYSIVNDTCNTSNISLFLKEEQLLFKQNFPNPAVGFTTIDYELPAACHVNLSVITVDGKSIKTLVKSKKKAGRHSVMFDASQLKPGMYLYTIDIEGKKQTMRMAVVDK